MLAVNSYSYKIVIRLQIKNRGINHGKSKKAIEEGES
jgi:hypothetical protein